MKKYTFAPIERVNPIIEDNVKDYIKDDAKAKPRLIIRDINDLQSVDDILKLVGYGNVFNKDCKSFIDDGGNKIEVKFNYTKTSSSKDGKKTTKWNYFKVIFLLDGKIHSFKHNNVRYPCSVEYSMNYYIRIYYASHGYLNSYPNEGIRFGYERRVLNDCTCNNSISFNKGYIGKIICKDNRLTNGFYSEIVNDRFKGLINVPDDIKYRINNNTLSEWIKENCTIVELSKFNE